MTARKNTRRHLLDLNPLYAVVGATELAADKLRELGADPATSDAAPDPATPDGEAPVTATPQASAASTAQGVLHDLAQLSRGARRAPAYLLDHARVHVARTQEAYDELAGRGRDLARRAEEASPVPAPSTLLRQANADLARRRNEARETALTTLAATRQAASARLGLRRDDDTVLGEVVTSGDAVGDRRTLRDAATDLSRDELRTVRTRRRTSAAARTAAPSPTRQSVEVEPIVKIPVLAGSGVEAGSTVTPATGTPATPRIAGSSARRTRVADAAARVAARHDGTDHDGADDAEGHPPVRVRHHRPDATPDTSTRPAPEATSEQPPAAD